jgi:hypothetical protein
MKKLLWSILIIFCFTKSYANKELERIDYDWEENPSLTDVTVKDTNISVYHLKTFSSVEFIYEDNQLVEYKLIHRKIKLLTERGINAYNKLYLPIYDENDFVMVKARVINSKGEIITLKEEDIKEGVDEDTERKYKYFAFDGVDKNAEVEYLYMYKKSPSYTGSLWNVQREEPQLDYDFEFISPWGLIFDFKSYNGLNAIEYDSSLYENKEKNRWFLSLDSIKYLPYQQSSAHEAQLQYFGYKLSANKYRGSSDLFSYGELSRLVYKVIFDGIDKQNQKFLKKQAKKMEIEKLKDEEEKIRAIENAVKSQMIISDISFASEVTIKDLWEIGLCDLSTGTKILVFFYDYFDIDVEVGLGCDRFDMKFDKDFELWSYTSEYFLYFPSIDQYTSANTYDRLNFLDSDYIFNYALFIKEVDLSGQKYGVGDCRFIPKNDYTNTGDTIIIKADIKKHGFSDMEYDVYHSVKGYKAQFYQTYYEYISDEESKTELEESLIKYIDENGVVSDLELKNFEAASYGVKPAIATATFNCDVFFEKAGESYLFKIGGLIGPQMEMYDDEERVLDVEDPYARHYYRVIEFTIPDDYEVKNLEQLNIDESVSQEGEEVMAFRSRYEKDGNKITVYCEEFYKEFYYPVEMYEEYRHIVNMAADFNKITLVFEKK